jgi:hypothetical protein
MFFFEHLLMCGPSGPGLGEHPPRELSWIFRLFVTRRRELNNTILGDLQSGKFHSVMKIS